VRKTKQNEQIRAWLWSVPAISPVLCFVALQFEWQMREIDAPVPPHKTAWFNPRLGYRLPQYIT